MIIYKVENSVNNKCYVGQTITTLETRFKKHRHTGNALYNAIKKYGKDNFTIVEIERCISKEHLDEREEYWIKKLNTLSPNGYNLRTGGRGRFKVSEETRKRISEVKQGTKSPFKGKPSGYRCTKEHKLKMSRLFKGRKPHENTIEANKKPVKCLNDGVVYGSVKEVSIKLGLNINSVSAVVNGRKNTIKGYKFEHINEVAKRKADLRIEERHVNKYAAIKRKVICLNSGVIYKSIAEAERELEVNNVHFVCSGKRGSTKGYKFQFLEDYENTKNRTNNEPCTL